MANHWMSKCVQCGSESLRGAVVKELSTVAGVEFTAELPALRCRKCGETYFDLSTLEAFEVGIATELGARGVRKPEAIAYIRKALGLRAVDLAKLLAVTSDTVSRWERGAVEMSPAVFAVLGALASDRRAGSSAMRDRLQAVHNDTAPRSPIKISAA